MDDKKFLTLVKDSICRNWDAPALTDIGSESYLFSDFAKQIAKIHMLFDAMELQKGEKAAICGRNSAHWAIALFSTLGYGAVATTILHDFSSENIHNIVNHSDSRILFVSEQNWQKLDPTQMPNVDTIIVLDDFSIQKSNSPALIACRSEWEDEFKRKYPEGFTRADIKFHDEDPEEMAILNYTSGTTSSPKGVMLPYRSIWSNTTFAVEMIPFVKAGDGLIAMLPMAHMYGLAFEILLGICKGCNIHFLTRVPSPQILISTFQQVNPSLIITVPLIIEKIIQSKVFPELQKQPTKFLLKIPFFRKMIYKKISQSLLPIFGNKMVEVVIGGAALNKEVGAFLTEIKFPYTVGYGMTECGPLIAYEYWETYKPESCGQTVDRMQVRVDSENPETIPGELHVKGDNVMLGYYNNEEQTKNTFKEDGWLNTGDLVTIDKDGFIFIKGRSKTMILGASGQNIYPEEIEDLFNNSPLIAESLVIEENKKLIALLFPDKDYVEKHGIKEKELNEALLAEMKAVNKKLPHFSTVSNFRIQQNEFEKTPKRSIKRFLYQK